MSTNENLNIEELLEVVEKYKRTKQLQKEWRENNKDKIKGYYKKHYKPVKDMGEEELIAYKEQVKKAVERNRQNRIGNTAAYLCKLAENRSKKQGIDFDITEHDIIVPKICPVLGIELCLTNTRIQDNSPSLDRIDPTKGYVKNNVMVMSFLANSMKRTADAEKLLKFADWIYLNFKITD